MKANMTIRIKRRSQPGWLVWILILMPLMLGTLNDFLGLPWALRYLLDAAWCVLLLLMIRFSRWVNIRGTELLLLWICVFLAYTFLAYVPQFQSPLYYLWGMRNNFRFYIAFFSFAAFLSQRDAEGYLKLFDKLFWLNIAVSLVQFFGFGLEGDYLGGIFGAAQGANAYTNIFFLIVTLKSVLSYLEKSESAASCVKKCAAALLVAALAEMKFFFVEFILLIILAVLFTEFTWRKFWLIMGGLAAVILGAALLTWLFPGFAGWFSVHWFVENALSDKGYTSSGDLNRLSAISRINTLWLKDIWQRLFGLGLGNCDTSNFALMNTPFYVAHSHMHYSWMSHSFMYLECGYVGLVFYLGFFVLCYSAAVRQQHRSGANVMYCRMARIMAIFCLLMTVYNSSLRTEAAYMVYFVLALPFVKNTNREAPVRNAA